MFFAVYCVCVHVFLFVCSNKNKNKNLVMFKERATRKREMLLTLTSSKHEHIVRHFRCVTSNISHRMGNGKGLAIYMVRKIGTEMKRIKNRFSTK